MSGIIVSNHGGRQLDGCVAAADVTCSKVVEATAGRAEVLVDGAIRRGTDVVKALALGARVLVGRPVLWGLAAAREAGVADVLAILRSEIDVAMGLCGCPEVSAFTRGLST